MTYAQLSHPSAFYSRHDDNINISLINQETCKKLFPSTVVYCIISRDSSKFAKKCLGFYFLAGKIYCQYSTFLPQISRGIKFGFDKIPFFLLVQQKGKINSKILLSGDS